MITRVVTVNMTDECVVWQKIDYMEECLIKINTQNFRTALAFTLHLTYLQNLN
jgi:hypothetical protein